MRKFVWLLFCLWAAAAVFPASAQDEAQTIQVKRGDTLLGIALAHGLTVGQLIAANPEADGTVILPGQTLVIPPADPAAFQRFMDAFYRQYVRIDSCNCYRQPSASAVCLAQITNLTDNPIGDIRFEFQLRDVNARDVQTEVAPFLTLLSPGESQLFTFPLPGDFSYPAAAGGTILSLKLFSGAKFSLLLNENDLGTDIVLSETGKSAEVRVQLLDEPVKQYYLVAAEAYSDDGSPIGVRADFLEGKRETMLTVYALTNRIAEVRVRVEGF